MLYAQPAKGYPYSYRQLANNLCSHISMINKHRAKEFEWKDRTCLINFSMFSMNIDLTLGYYYLYFYCITIERVSKITNIFGKSVLEEQYHNCHFFCYCGKSYFCRGYPQVDN